MPTSAKYVLETPKISAEKQGPAVHSAANLHSINGQTSRVMVVPHNSKLTTAWDCCILQYCLMAHFLKNEPGSRLSVMVQTLAPSLKKQSHWLLREDSRGFLCDSFNSASFEVKTGAGKGLIMRELAHSINVGKVHKSPSQNVSFSNIFLNVCSVRLNMFLRPD